MWSESISISADLKTMTFWFQINGYCGTQPGSNSVFWDCMWLIKPFTLQLNTPKKETQVGKNLLGPSKLLELHLNLRAEGISSLGPAGCDAPGLNSKEHWWIGNFLTQGDALVLVVVQNPVWGCLAPCTGGWEGAIGWGWECVWHSAKGNRGCVTP